MISTSQPAILLYSIQMVFRRHGFTSRGQVLGRAFGSAVCKIQARKHYLESLPSLSKDKRAASFKKKGPLYSYLLMAHLWKQDAYSNLNIWFGYKSNQPFCPLYYCCLEGSLGSQEVKEERMERVCMYAPHNPRICAFSESQDCALQLCDLEIAHYTCVISRLRNYSAQSFTLTHMCRNPLVVTRSREATKKL